MKEFYKLKDDALIHVPVLQLDEFRQGETVGIVCKKGEVMEIKQEKNRVRFSCRHLFANSRCPKRTDFCQFA